MGAIHTRRRLKYFFYTIAVLIACTLLAGISTFAFTETQGTIMSASKSEVQGAAYPNRYGATEGDKQTVLKIQYGYYVGNKNFENSVVAFWFTESPSETYSSGKNVQVFYLSFYPKIAVLKRGPDKWLLISVIVAFFGWLFMKSILREKN